MSRHRLVSRLFYAGCPSAVARLVAAIVVDSVDGVLRRWFRAHVFKERRKAVSPSVAHGYPPSSVETKLVVSWVVATADHLRPRRVLRRHLAAGSGAMERGALYQQARPCLGVEAPARLCAPLSQRRGANDDLVSTIANAPPAPNTFPARLSTWIRKRGHPQSAEAVAR